MRIVVDYDLCERCALPDKAGRSTVRSPLSSHGRANK